MSSAQLKLGTQTELPPDYIELEKRVDALKQVHQKLLQVTYAWTTLHLHPRVCTNSYEARNTQTKPMTTLPTSANPLTISDAP